MIPLRGYLFYKSGKLLELFQEKRYNKLIIYKFLPCEGIMKRKGRKKGKVILLLLILVAGLLAAGCCQIPYFMAESTMPMDGILTMEEQNDGTLLLSWPVADLADYYRVDILTNHGEEQKVIWQENTDSSQGILLPELPAEEEYTLQVHSVREYTIFGQVKARIGEEPLAATTVLRAPRIVEFQWEPDPDEKIVSIVFEMLDADFAVFSHLEQDGTLRELQRLGNSDRIDLRFGDDGDFKLPEYGEACELVMNVYRQEEGLEFYGAADIHVRIDREDLLGRDLNLVLEQESNNVVSLQWQETKGEYYQIQRSVAGRDWDTIWEIYPGQELTYRSEHLDPFEDYAYRVVAMGGQTMEGCDYAAISQEMSFRTRESAVYTTVWPVKDLKVLAAPGSDEVIGHAKVGRNFCVLDEVKGFFQVQVDGQTGYIDSNYCMINLPEYLGDLCSYDIKNSYDSIYYIHGFEIPEVSGVVTAGYQNVLLADGSFVVPLLYPTARKLVAAGEEALERGYRLKIYDAFRPNVATNEIYNLTSKILGNELPEVSVTGEPATNYQQDEEIPVTYQMLMTNGTYQLTHFLAKGVSRHNQGVALDLTLEDAKSGKEVVMQSSMHDLSWYSVTGRNNSRAKMLATIMKGVGFATLSSEWWHFQDDEARKAYSIPSVSKGVNLEGWTADDRGWMYRDRDGVYYKNQTLTIEGVAHRFDADGYLVLSE